MLVLPWPFLPLPRQLREATTSSSAIKPAAPPAAFSLVEAGHTPCTFSSPLLVPPWQIFTTPTPASGSYKQLLGNQASGATSGAWPCIHTRTSRCKQLHPQVFIRRVWCPRCMGGVRGSGCAAGFTFGHPAQKFLSSRTGTKIVLRIYTYIYIYTYIVLCVLCFQDNLEGKKTLQPKTNKYFVSTIKNILTSCH